MYDTPGLGERSLEQLGVALGSTRREEQILSVPVLHQLVVPETPAERAGALEAVASEPLHPVVRPLLVPVTVPSLARHRSAEEDVRREFAQRRDQPIAGLADEVLENLERQGEIEAAEIRRQPSADVVPHVFDAIGELGRGSVVDAHRSGSEGCELGRPPALTASDVDDGARLHDPLNLRNDRCRASLGARANPRIDVGVEAHARMIAAGDAAVD